MLLKLDYYLLKRFVGLDFIIRKNYKIKYFIQVNFGKLLILLNTWLI